MNTFPVLNFRWHIPGMLATGGKPSRIEQLHWLCQQGIRAILSLELIPESVIAEIKVRGINHIYIPCFEYEDVAHDPEAWNSFSRFIFANIQAGNPVFVHCSAGIRRSVRLVERYLRLEAGKTSLDF
jgi:hypothetical protein